MEPDTPENNPSPSIVQATGLRRIIYVTIGLFFVALGVIGAILPVLPTTPFLLLASFFFVRSSNRLNRWLIRSRIFGPFLRDWQEKRGVRRSVKWTAFVMIAVVIASSIYFGQLTLPLAIVLCLLGAIGAIVVWRLPTIDGAASTSATAPAKSTAAPILDNQDDSI